MTFDGGAIIQGAATDDLLQTLTTLADDVQTGNMAGIDAAIAELERRRSIASPTRRRGSASISRRLADDRAPARSLRRASDTRRSDAEDANLAEAISGDAAGGRRRTRPRSRALATAGRLSLMDYLK